MTRAVALGVAALGLSGCAAMVQDDWHEHPTHPPLVPHHVEVPARDLTRVCGNHGGTVYGCAYRVVDARICIIYTESKPAAWLMAHELKHCAGWDHGPTRMNAIAAAATAP